MVLRVDEHLTPIHFKEVGFSPNSKWFVPLKLKLIYRVHVFVSVIFPQCLIRDLRTGLLLKIK